MALYSKQSSNKFDDQMLKLERRLLVAALRLSSDSVEGAARILGITRQRLRWTLKRQGMWDKYEQPKKVKQDRYGSNE